MTHLRFLPVFVIALMLAACSGLEGDTSSYPQETEDARRERRGSLLGEDGFTLFDGGDNDDRTGAATGIGVNEFLWRGALDTLSFMPLASADPFGGVIITDWYASPESPDERFKINVLILDQRLRPGALKVTAFRQEKHQGGWKDASLSGNVTRELEDAILTRARELRARQLRRQ